MFDQVILELKREARESYAKEADLYLKTRKEFFQETLDTFSNYRKTLSKAKLDELRYAHRNELDVLLRRFEREKRQYINWYAFYCAVYFLRMPIIVISIFLSTISIVKHVNTPTVPIIAISIVVVYIGILAILALRIAFIMRKMMYTYKLIGCAEALLTVCDYRNMEKINLDKLL